LPLTWPFPFPFATIQSHGLCKRCGRRSFHKQHHTCASCGYPAAKIRSFEWGQKAKRRKTTGTGRMAHLKDVNKRFKNGYAALLVLSWSAVPAADSPVLSARARSFREGTVAVRKAKKTTE